MSNANFPGQGNWDNGQGDSFQNAPIGSVPGAIIAGGTKRGRRRHTKTVGRGSSTRMRWLFLLFAGAVGLLGVLVTVAPSNKVYVARSSGAISALTLVDDTKFEVVQLDKDAVEPNSFSGTSADSVKAQVLDAIDGAWFLYPVPAGQQLRATMLTTSGQLANPLLPDERLISITARASNAVAGSIKPGNFVDIYVSDPNGLTGVLGQNVEIVAVSLLPEQLDSVAQQQFNDPDKSLSDFVSSQSIGGTYVVRVKANDVAKYIAADTAGKITLSLYGSGATPFAAIPSDMYQAICGANSAEPACVRAGS